MILPIIMAGGSGSRLWPLSRELYPKQFLNLDGELTMLQTTINRLSSLNCVSPLVICNEEHRFLAAEQLRKINKLSQNIILEPVGRNTAPAIGLAAFCALQKYSKDNDPLLLVLAADHVIRDEKAFTCAIRRAINHAEQGKLVTFGILPTHAETGYGYIRRGVNVNDGFTVDAFVEKPDLDTARDYIDSGEYYWNSGMFLFRASRYLSELKRFRQDIFDACSKSVGTINPDLDFIRVDTEAFLNCPSDSIDYAVMEKTDEAVVVPMDAGWSDVGSWDSLWRISDKDSQGNVLRGDVIQDSSNNNYVFAETGLVALVGVQNLVVVQTEDAVLVADKNQVQNVKSIVDMLKSAERNEHRVHREIYRAWGRQNSIDKGTRYHVKRITVNPGDKVSLQMHHHRAEHWIVVSGTAKVTHGDNSFFVTENESTYIPVGIIHGLENPGKIPLELIEVCSGSYLGEDDIIRI